MSGSTTVKSGNDATDAAIAANNCAYCAVGGLFGKSANEIMRDVYSMSAVLSPSGGPASDGSAGFVLLYKSRIKTPVIGLHRRSDNDQEFQILGVDAYLKQKGCAVTWVGSTKNLLKKNELILEANKVANNALFLVFTGDEDFPGQGITSAAHWTMGQVQNGKAMFYDYQMKISGLDARTVNFLARRAKIKLGETGMTDYPVVAWGRKLDDDDGRGILLVVSKLKKS